MKAGIILLTDLSDDLEWMKNSLRFMCLKTSLNTRSVKPLPGPSILSFLRSANNRKINGHQL